MAITIGLADGRRITTERDTATIGRGPGADVVVASDEIQPIHARVLQVAGRWMVESTGDWLLQAGDSVPGRKQWLAPDRVIWLTESGVMVVFDPSARQSPDNQQSVLEDTGMFLEEEGTSSSFWTNSSLQLSPKPQSPSFPPPLTSVNSPTAPPLPLPACYAKVVGATIEFRGAGVVMIGKGTVNFTGKRCLANGQSAPGSLIVPLSDVANVSIKSNRITVAFLLGDALARLTFDALNTDEAKEIATALERDELGERQRKRSEALGRTVALDPSTPRFFTVVFEADSCNE